MQQIALFNLNTKKIKRGVLAFELLDKKDSYSLGLLSIPSGKFIVKYFFVDGKIDNFEIIDYTGLYITVSLIKTIKNLLSLLLVDET